MIDTVLYGQRELQDRDWRTALRIPGILVTDAKRLYDHLQKDGPSKRSVRRPWMYGSGGCRTVIGLRTS